jgi:hypothetical protein
MKAEGLVEKPFVPKKRSFTFPPVEKMGTNVVDIKVRRCGVCVCVCLGRGCMCCLSVVPVAPEVVWHQVRSAGQHSKA